jgi:Bax protein
MLRVLLFLIAGVLVAESLAGSDGETFEFTSYADVDPLFETLGYTPDDWRAGSRVVPRVYLMNIPERWRDKYSKEITTLAKKRLFFRALAPLVLRANELLLLDRARLEKVAQQVQGSVELSGEDVAWLTDLARAYRVVEKEDTVVGEKEIAELRVRVDLVPLSLALSQAAEESGWGTSRFAAEGNSLFGQWTWGGKGITPKDQRSGMGDYKMAAFDSPLESVQGYVRNLNTHRAYADLRKERARLREAGKPISGAVLAKTLINYSERGEAYVESLEAIMRVNKLAPTDSTYLGEMTPIYLVPVGPGAD